MQLTMLQFANGQIQGAEGRVLCFQALAMIFILSPKSCLLVLAAGAELVWCAVRHVKLLKEAGSRDESTGK